MKSLNKLGQVITGELPFKGFGDDPIVVLEAFEQYWKELRFGNLLVMCQFGTLPAELTRANMERFARGVMPRLRALN